MLEDVFIFFDIVSIFNVSVCEKPITGRQKKMINTLNNEHLERAHRFAVGKLARDDWFCTGAGFIIYKMTRLLRFASGETRNKNTFPLAFKFLLAKFNNFHPDSYRN